MHYEEDNHRRHHHEQRQQHARRRERSNPDENDFRSRWREPSSEYLHPRERQWSEGEREEYYKRGDYRDINYEQEQRRGQHADRRDEHLFNREHDLRNYRNQNEDFNSNNQHANDRWREAGFRRYFNERHPDERRRGSSDEEEWQDHRNR